MSLDKAMVFDVFNGIYDKARGTQKPHEIYKQEMAYLASIIEENEDLLYGLFWDEYNKYLDAPESQRRFTSARFMELFDGIMQKPTNRAVRFAGGLLLDPHYPVRDFVAEALGRMGSIDAYNYLVGVVHHEDYQIASRAVRALGKIGAVQAEPLLIDILNGNDQVQEWQNDDTGDIVQEYALWGLYYLDTPTAWETIEEVVGRSGFDLDIREQAISLLANKKGKVIAPLLERLIDDENPSVQQSAAYYLREFSKSS